MLRFILLIFLLISSICFYAEGLEKKDYEKLADYEMSRNSQKALSILKDIARQDGVDSHLNNDSYAEIALHAFCGGMDFCCHYGIGELAYENFSKKICENEDFMTAMTNVENYARFTDSGYIKSIEEIRNKISYLKNNKRKIRLISELKLMAENPNSGIENDLQQFILKKTQSVSFTADIMSRPVNDKEKNFYTKEFINYKIAELENLDKL